MGDETRDEARAKIPKGGRCCRRRVYCPMSRSLGRDGPVVAEQETETKRLRPRDEDQEPKLKVAKRIKEGKRVG